MVESKLTKKSCPSAQHEIELLGLIHYDLADLKQTMTGGGIKLLQRRLIEYFIFQL